MRLAFIGGCLIIGAIAAYFGQPFVAGNSNVLVIIITVLTVFAGFLVAIIAILGDPAMIPDGTWRTAEVRRENVESRLIVHVWLFVVYLIAIGALFVGALLTSEQNLSTPQWIKTWIERAYLFSGVSAFLLTFGLPAMLLRVQMGRLDGEIARRRREAGLPD